jgi:hypothetical protein
MSPIVTDRDAGVLLLLLGLGAAAYYEDEDALIATRELLDRIPTEHLIRAMRKFQAAAEIGMEGSDAG